MKTKYVQLFTPFKIGKLEVKNRFHMSAMGGNDHILPDGSFSKQSAEYYIRRAKGGYGLLSTGTITIRKNEGEKYLAEEQFIDEDIDKAAFKMSCWEFIRRVHACGAKMMIQLSLGTTPSQIPGVFSPSVSCNEFTKEEIAYFIGRYADAAKLVKDAGFDMIEVHAVHTGYILDQFCTEATNHRTDEYGGSLEGRAKLAIDILKAIKGACGEDFPVSIKLGMTTDIYDYQADGTVKVYKRGLEESLELAKLFEEAGYDAVNSDGVKNNSIYCPRETNLDYFKALRKAVKIPMIIAGRFNEPEFIEKLLEDGVTDFVSMGRQTLCDPDFVNKLKSNKEEEIRFCLACNQACIAHTLYGYPVTCAINPTANAEAAQELIPAGKKKKVLVAGGGLAGMEAARIADLRGHEVSLYERADYLGGVFVPASAFYFKEEDRRLIDWYKLQIEKSGIAVHMNTEVTKELIEEEKPDVVIVASGAKEFKLPVDGIDKPIVASAIDVLMKRRETGEKVVIIGGGLTGCELSVQLAREGKEVTVVEMLPDILRVPNPVGYNISGLKGLMQKGEVKVMAGTALKQVCDEGVVLCYEGKEELLEAETVVIAVGYRKDAALYESLSDYAGEVYAIGDCDKVSNVMNAVWSGYSLACGL